MRLRALNTRPLAGAFLLPVLLLVFTHSMAAATPAKYAIASAHPLATGAGMQILAEGGNAFDAAITVSAVLAVVEPYSSGIGGGGFWLLHRHSDGKQVMIDGRERAPLKAHQDLYLDGQGDVVPGLSIDGALAAGIPGEPAALAHLAQHYGRLPLERTLAPAIEAAEQGFEVDEYYRRMAGFRLEALRRQAPEGSVFLHDNEVPETGFVVRQPDLARTLRALARQGHDGFYAGEVASRLVEGVTAAGGIWTHEDLSGYRVVERDPIVFEYRDMRVVSASPPSSGGVALATMLNILEPVPLDSLPEDQRVHLVVEAMRRAYRDRAEYMGDPDFVDMPLERLLDRDYAAGLRASIRDDRATESASLPGRSVGTGGADTTHFSILDAEGNRVAATLSINYPFGAALVVPGTGVLLNDEMDDFSAKPGVPNAYGLVGAAANAIAPGKRPLSSMTPTFVESEEGIAILGGPGGSRIITMVLLGILDLAEGNGPQSWVSRPRFHHQFLPDLIQFEVDALSAQTRESLVARGHRLKPLDNTYGNMQAIHFNTRSGEVSAASDPRGVGQAASVPVSAGTVGNKSSTAGRSAVP